jgi:hypothetical protein
VIVSSLIRQREAQSILYLAGDIAVTVNPRCLAVQFDPTIIVQNVSSYLVLKFPTPACEDVCPADILHADRFSAEEKIARFSPRLDEAGSRFGIIK